MPAVGGASAAPKSSPSPSSSTKGPSSSSKTGGDKGGTPKSSSAKPSTSSSTPTPTKQPATPEQQQASRTRAAGAEADAKGKILAQQQAKPKISGPSGTLKAGVDKNGLSVEGKGHAARLGTEERGAKVGSVEGSVKVGKDGVEAKGKASLFDIKAPAKNGGQIKADVFKAEGKAKLDGKGVTLKGDARTVEGTYTSKDGKVSVTGKGPGVEAEFSLNPGKVTDGKTPGSNDKLFKAKVGADAGAVEGTLGKNDAKKGDDTQYHGGLRAGLKGGVEVDKTDKDGDGKPEYTVKIDAGPISFGITQEGSTPLEAARNLMRKWGF